MQIIRLISLIVMIFFFASCGKEVKRETVIKEKSLDLQVIEVYNEGMKMLDSYYVNFKKQFKNKDLTSDDKINLISFITLPLSVFNFSKINHNYTNIQTKSNLNLQYLNYQRLSFLLQLQMYQI